MLLFSHIYENAFKKNAKGKIDKTVLLLKDNDALVYKNEMSLSAMPEGGLFYNQPRSLTSDFLNSFKHSLINQSIPEAEIYQSIFM